MKKSAGLILILLLTMLLLLSACAVAFAGTDKPGGANIPGATSWYLAEGSTASTTEGSFETWIGLSNSGTRAVVVDITYMTGEGKVPGPENIVIGPGAATTIDVSESVPNNWSVSTKVDSSGPVVAERQMFWNTGMSVTGQPFHQCAHSSIGVTETATTWYLAEGSTGSDSSGNFESWILVQNPNNNAATVDINYQTPGGQVNGPQDVEIPANGRMSFDVAKDVPSQWSVSTAVISDRPVIAERSVYWNSIHAKRQAAHDSIGVTAPAKTWYLAEGSTGVRPGDRIDAGNFETWILVQNPNAAPAEVDITFQTPNGTVEGPRNAVIDPFSRRTFDVAQYVPGEWSVSTQVTSSENIIAERSVYWDIPYAIYTSGTFSNIIRWCGHDSIGIVSPDYNWEIANCRTDTAFESWILIQNPTGNEATVDIDYTTPDGIVHGPQNFKVAGGTRRSVRVNDKVQDIQDVGATVRGNNNVKVVVEHSTYWGPAQGEDPQNYRVSGFDTIAFPWSKLN